MNTRNLIPASRQRLKCRQAALRRWVLIDGIYLGLMVLAGAGYVATYGGARPVNSAGNASVEIQQSLAKVAMLRQQSVALGVSVRSVTDAAGSPDWSALLAVLSNALGDDVVLNAVDCAPAKDGGAVSPQLLRLSGIGRSQNAVSAYVLSLEDLKLFDRVDLVQTAPQSLRGSDCVGFELQCSLPTAGGRR